MLRFSITENRALLAVVDPQKQAVNDINTTQCFGWFGICSPDWNVSIKNVVSYE